MRKYMILLRRDTMAWNPEIDRIGHQSAFEALFARGLTMYGHELLRSPPEPLAEMRRAMAEARGLPPAQASGKEWKWFHILPPGIRHNVKSSEARCRIAGTAGASSLITATQRTKYASIMPVCPAILRNTVIWSTHLRRPAHPLEHFELMGWKMFPGEGASDDEVECASFSSMVAQLSPKLQASLVGNGFHLGAVGCCIIFALAGSWRVG